MGSNLKDINTAELVREMEMRGFVCIPKDDLAILTVNGYFAEYRRQMSLHKTYRKAWEATEDKLYLLFGIEKYHSYSSLRSAVWRKKTKKR